MMIVMHPTYQFRVTIKDRMRQPDSNSVMAQSVAAAGGADWNPHKYFDSAKGKSGCDEAMADLKAALSKAGIEADVWLENFKHS